MVETVNSKMNWFEVISAIVKMQNELLKEARGSEAVRAGNKSAKRQTHAVKKYLSRACRDVRAEVAGVAFSGHGRIFLQPLHLCVGLKCNITNAVLGKVLTFNHPPNQPMFKTDEKAA